MRLTHTGLYHSRATRRLAALASAGDEIAVSDVVRLECRVKHVRTGNTAQLAVFDAFFAKPDVRMIAITTPVFDRATLIRATHNFKLGDALNLAAAVIGGCDRFLTNDARLSSVTDIAVEVLP
jgi:uncharacterized protein